MSDIEPISNEDIRKRLDMLTTSTITCLVLVINLQKSFQAVAKSFDHVVAMVDPTMAADAVEDIKGILDIKKHQDHINECLRQIDAISKKTLHGEKT